MENMEYMKPKSLGEALNSMEKWGKRAKLIAGGTNLIPNVRSKTLSPELIIDLSSLENLAYIKHGNGTVSIGALTTISELASSTLIRKSCPVLFSAANQLGNPLTRNRATIGGNLADASPAADMAPPLMALEATIHTERTKEKARQIPLDMFFRGPNQTVLGDDEIIREITFTEPKKQAKGSYIKLGLRNSMAISVVSVAVMLEMEKTMCRKARVALGAVAPKPIRAHRVEALLEGREIDVDLINECSEFLTEEISPISDIRATAEYRKLTTSVLLKRAVQEALS